MDGLGALTLRDWVELLLLMGLTVLSIGRWVEGTKLRHSQAVDGHATVQGAMHEIWQEINALKLATSALQVTLAQLQEAGVRRDQEINRLRDWCDRCSQQLRSFLPPSKR